MYVFYYLVHYSFDQFDHRQVPPAKHHINYETIYISIIFQNFPLLKKYL